MNHKWEIRRFSSKFYEVDLVRNLFFMWNNDLWALSAEGCVLVCVFSKVSVFPSILGEIDVLCVFLNMSVFSYTGIQSSFVLGSIYGSQRVIRFVGNSFALPEIYSCFRKFIFCFREFISIFGIPFWFPGDPFDFWISMISWKFI